MQTQTKQSVVLHKGCILTWDVYLEIIRVTWEMRVDKLARNLATA